MELFKTAVSTTRLVSKGDLAMKMRKMLIAVPSILAVLFLGGATAEAWVELPPGICWLTGGGIKLEPVTGPPRLAEGQTKITTGGVVHPACDGAGGGGNWNHVDHTVGLHFKGTSIPTVGCGNTDLCGHSGSTSPTTDFNVIQFEGTGTLQGIQGNKFPLTDVCFAASAVDCNEPGANGANDGAAIDRYSIVVFDCGTGETIYAFGGYPGTLPIATGNMQMHSNPCDNPPLGF